MISRKRSTRGRKFPPSPITADEFRRMIAACNPKVDLGLRAIAMLLTLQRTGIRVSEMVRLRPDDVSDQEHELRVVGGKGGRKSRVIGLNPEAAAAITAWMERRTARGISPDKRLFCTADGHQLSTNGARELLKRIARRAGIASRVTPHQCRHSFAIHLAKSGVVRLDEIQAALGHESLHTTQKYLAGMGGETAIQAVQRVLW